MGPEFVLLSLTLAGLVITLCVLYSRARNQQLAHEERMAALDKGVTVPPMPPQRPWSPRVYLLRGLIWSFCGAALIICLLGLASASPSHRGVSAMNMAFDAKRLMDMTGISREEANRIVEKDAAQQSEKPPAAIALLGLIPLSVGLAYLVFYYTGERHSPEEPRGEAIQRIA